MKEFRAEISKATGGKGPDVIYDPVGADFTEPALRSIAWNGRFYSWVQYIQNTDELVFN